MVVDTNVFNHFYAAGLVPQAGRLISQFPCPFVTLRSVYMREAQDAVRNQCIEKWRQSGQIKIVDGPERRRSLPKKERKLYRKIRRRARNDPTSKVDDQLVFVAADRGLPLVTTERPIRNVAKACGVRWHDFIDVADALREFDLLDRGEWQDLYVNWPVHSDKDTLTLYAESEEREADDRFECN